MDNLNSYETNYEDDFFNSSNERYNKATAYPTVDVPYLQQNSRRHTDTKSNFQAYNYHTQKFDFLENSDATRSLSEVELPDIVSFAENYNVSKSLTASEFDYMAVKLNIFSKVHHREKLFELLKSLPDSEYRIKQVKKSANAYENVFEGFFTKNVSIKVTH